MKPPVGYRVLVTGGTGFVGSHLLERLEGLGMRVRCLVRRRSKSKLPRGIEAIEGDLASAAGLPEAVSGAQIVFHLAGVTKAHSRAEFYRGNVLGTRNLLRACEEHGGALNRLIHISSLAAVGPSPSGKLLDEDAHAAPLTHYGISKLQAEELVRSSGVASKTVILRPPAIYGPRDTDVLEIFKAASRGLLLRIGTREQLVSILHVSDLVEAMLDAVRSPQAPGHTYFVANAQPVAWSEFAGLAAEFMGKTLRTVSVTPRVANMVGFLMEMAGWIRRKPGIVNREKIREAQCQYWLCDTARAQRDLGFRERISLREGIASTLTWYRRAGWLNY